MRKNLLYSLALLCFALLLSNCERTELSIDVSEQEPVLKTSSIINSYIVIFKNDGLTENSDESYRVKKDKVKDKADKLFSSHKLKSKTYKHIYGKALKGFVTDLTDEEFANLSQDESVLRIEKDKIITLSPITIKKKPGPTVDPAQSIPWGIARVGGPVSGIGKTAWIIDSGIDLDHPDLNVDTQNAAQFLGSRYTPDDQNGHGTHVAGTVAALDNSIGVVGVAPGANVVPVRVLDRRGSGTTSGVIAGVDYVAANASPGDVANMSLGGGISTTLDQAVLAASSVLKFVLAAGNESDNADNHSPARVDGNSIYTISAMDKNDNWAYFSNYGSGVDYCAPGYSIYSSYKNGGYSTLSGTSMAAPHVCGLLLLSNNLSTDGYVIGDPDGVPDPIAHH